MKFCDTVKKIRDKSGLTQGGFALELNVCKLLISQYETGYRKRPAIDIAKRLITMAKELHIPLTMDEIYG